MRQESKSAAPPATRIAVVAALSCLTILCLGAARAKAEAPPGPTRIVRAPGEIVPIPASIPHEEGDMIDRRIVPDLLWIAARYPIYITDGYSGPVPGGGWAGCHGCHVRGSDHYNGLAVDIVPVGGGTTCDAAWAPITRLALWAEPVQNQPLRPFRWVGYNGDPGHGCGNHLHLSWNHAPAAKYQLAEWVEVFPATAAELGETGETPPRTHRGRRPKRTPRAPSTPSGSSAPSPSGPSGGVSRAPTGGVGVGGPND